MEKTKEQIIAEARKYEKWVYDLDGAVRVLKDAKNIGWNIYIDFNGHKLYSLLDDEDSCYHKVLGISKAESEERERKWHEEYEAREKKEKAEAEAKIPSWLERGEKIIYPQRKAEWKRCVEIRAGDLYHGYELENALQAMELLEAGGSFEEAKKIIDDAGHSGCSYGIAMSIILTFSKHGPKFFRFMEADYMSEDREKAVKKVEEQNAEYEKALSSQPGDDDK